MNTNRARAFANAWLRAMRIYAGALTRAINEDTLDDSRYFLARYGAAHLRWVDAVARISAMNLAAAEAAFRHSRKAGDS